MKRSHWTAASSLALLASLAVLVVLGSAETARAKPKEKNVRLKRQDLDAPELVPVGLRYPIQGTLPVQLAGAARAVRHTKRGVSVDVHGDGRLPIHVRSGHHRIVNLSEGDAERAILVYEVRLLSRIYG